MHVVLNWYWVHTLIKVTAKIKLVHKIDLFRDHLKHPKRLLIKTENHLTFLFIHLSQFAELL